MTGIGHDYLCTHFGYMVNNKSTGYHQAMTNTQKERTSKQLVSGGNTDMQLAFIDHLVTGNMNPTEAARQAGYAQPKQAAYRLTRAPHIQAAIRQARQTIYSGELTNMAIGTLKTVMTDPDAPASSKVSAARTVFELAGDLGKLSGEAGQTGQLAEMSPEQLAQLIDRWENEKNTINGSATVVEPQET